MDSRLRILHLSDLHFNKANEYDLKSFIMPPLLKDLKNYHINKNIDIVIISGDLLDRGGIGFNNIGEGFNSFKTEIIDQIANELSINSTQFFFSPGNHDIDRSLDSEIVEIGTKAHLINTESVIKFQDEKNMSNYEGIKRIIPFKKFEFNYYENTEIEKDQSVFQSSYKIKINDFKIGIACINSAWRCFSGKNEKGNLIIGERQISRSLDFFNDCTIKILVAHHYLDYLCEFERKIIDNYVTENFHFAFLGHNHSPETWSKSIMRGELFTSIGRCNWAYNIRTNDSDYKNGYSLIDYDPSKNTINQHMRIYSHKRKEYVSDTDCVGDKGFCTFKISNQESRISFLHKIASHIEETFLHSVNEDLLTHGTDTTAPSDINEIFVEPRIAHWQKQNDTKEEFIKIDDICKSDKNFVIFGSKETGKTVLLDKLLIHFIELINELRKIPIYINFEDFKHSRIHTAISNFTGVPIPKIDDLIKKNTLILIVDNISFEEQHKHKLKKVISFLETYKNARLICSCLQPTEGQIPLEYFENALFAESSILTLKYYKSKQIKQLTENWYSKSNISNKKDHIEKIIKLLLTLELPRTPLAISMFLWIFEKQEEFNPVNQAVMLENFIEQLFKKHSREEVFFNRFNYKNKEHLLSSIAHKMYIEKNDNYSLSYSELLNFTVNHLKKRKFDFSAEKIITHFLDVGLMTKNIDNTDSIIRFRFNCFFQYFLMKNMDKPEFCEYVMKEDNYLSFFEEIDYYTGIKRDKADILKTIIERMLKQYEDLKNDFKRLHGGLDTFFSTEQSIASQLDRGFIESIQEEKVNIKEDIEELQDSMMETIKPKETVDKKDFNLSPFHKLERSWILAARVLRNTEETEEENLKYNSFISILESSLYFLCLYKFLIFETLKRNHETLSNEKKDETEMLINFLPILHESLLFDVLSSGKLELIFKEHIDKILNKKNVSDLEKLITIFLYSDGKGKENIKYIKKLIGNVKNKYTYDMILFKMVSYYFLRSNNNNSDILFENIIADIIVLSQKKKKTQKTKIINMYKDKKKKIISQEQQELDFGE